MKSWGRAIHVGIEDNVGDYSVLIDSVHGCLSDRTQDRGMQLFLKKGIGYSEYFRGYVDFVVAVRLGQKSEVRMTLLDPKYIISKDKNGDTENGQRTIRHGLFQFAKELQNLLKEYDAIQNERIDKTEESYLGVTISLKGTLKNTVFANSGLE